MVLFADRLTARVHELRCPVVAGLDPRADLLSAAQRRRAGGSVRQTAQAYVDFAQGFLDGLVGVVPAVKIQIAFYEALGLPGMHAYVRSIRAARDRGLIVIGDIKRGDIGTTAEAYASGHLGQVTTNARYDVDAVTLNPYLGVDSVQPFLTDAFRHKGAFALVRTSNKSARELQDLTCDGKPLFEHVAARVVEWGRDRVGTCGYSSLGAVVGATYPAELARIRSLHPGLLLLIPGYGAQGGGARDVVAALDEHGGGALIASSRGLMVGYREAADAGRPPDLGVRVLAEKMRDEIHAAWLEYRRNPRS